MPRWTVFALTALLGAVFTLPAAAQWKWVDRNRQVQYSDRPPPPDTPEQDILQRPGGVARRTTVTAAPMAASPPAAAASGAPLAPKGVEPELEARRRKAEQDEAAKKKVDDDRIAAAKADNCQRGQAAMRALESGVRLARTNAKGEREFLDDAARAEEAKHAQNAIATNCR